MSEVWNHFQLAPNGLSVTCHHCGKFMKRSDSSTKSMWGHLNSFHKEAVGEETFQLKRKRRIYPRDPNGPAPRKRKPRRKLGENVPPPPGSLAGANATHSSTGEEEDEEEEQDSNEEACSSVPTTVAGSPVQGIQSQKSGGGDSGKSKSAAAVDGANANNTNNSCGGAGIFGASLENANNVMLAHFHQMLMGGGGAGGVYPNATTNGGGPAEWMMMLNPALNMHMPGANHLFPGLYATVNGSSNANNNNCSSAGEKKTTLQQVSAPVVEEQKKTEEKKEDKEKTPTQPYVKRKRSRASPPEQTAVTTASSPKIPPSAQSNQNTHGNRQEDNCSRANGNTTTTSSFMDSLIAVNGNLTSHRNGVQQPLQQPKKAAGELNTVNSGFLLNASGAFDANALMAVDPNLLGALDQATLMSFMGELLKESEKLSNLNALTQLNHSMGIVNGSNNHNASTAAQKSASQINFGDIASLAAATINSAIPSNHSPQLGQAKKMVSSPTLNGGERGSPIVLQTVEEKVEAKSATSNGKDTEIPRLVDVEGPSPPPKMRRKEEEQKATLRVNGTHMDVEETPPFFISNPEGLFALHKVAFDLELTYSAHGRRGIPEYCFESNRTAERSGTKGRMITLTETPSHVQISERVNGFATASETWTKTTLQQLVWAIRGKCQKCFGK